MDSLNSLRLHSPIRCTGCSDQLLQLCYSRYVGSDQIGRSSLLMTIRKPQTLSIGSPSFGPLHTGNLPHVGDVQRSRHLSMLLLKVSQTHLISILLNKSTIQYFITLLMELQMINFEISVLKTKRKFSVKQILAHLLIINGAIDFRFLYINKIICLLFYMH